MAVRLKNQELVAEEECLLLMMRMMKKKVYQEILGHRKEVVECEIGLLVDLEE